MPRIHVNQFHNGFSKFETQGFPGQFLRGLGLNIKNTQLGTFRLNHKPILSSLTGGASSQYNDNGTLYFIGSSGVLYKTTFSNPTSQTTLDSTAGSNSLLIKWNNRLYYNIGANVRYYDLTNTTANSYQTLNSGANPIGLIANNILYISNGSDLASIDSNNTWTASAFALPSGYAIVDLASWQDYIIILYQAPNGTGGLIYWLQDSQFVADSIIPINDIPQLLWNDNGTLRVILGGDLKFYNVDRVFSIVRLNYEYTLAPYAISEQYGGYQLNPTSKAYANGMLYFGIYNADILAGQDGIPVGIYSYGTRDPQIPPSVNLEYVGSNTDTSSNQQITSLCISNFAYNQYEMSVGWINTSSGTSKSIDTISSSAYGTGSASVPAYMDTLVFDAGQPEVLKRWDYFSISAKPYNSAIAITVLYKADDGSWTTLSGQSIKTSPTNSSNNTLIEYPMPVGLLARRIQFRIEIDNSSNTANNIDITSYTIGYEQGQSRI